MTDTHKPENSKIVREEKPQEVVIKNTPDVIVKNFPRSRWERRIAILSLLIGLFSVLVAAGSLSLYYQEVTRSPEMSLYFTTPSEIIGKAFLTFNNGRSSPKELQIFTENSGNKESRSLAVLIMFNPLMNISLINSNAHLKEYKKLGEAYSLYSFEDDFFLTNPKNSKELAKFMFSLPEDESLMAMFVIRGDFQQKTGLLFYSNETGGYVVQTFDSANNASSIWAEHVAEWNKHIEFLPNGNGWETY